MANQKKNQEIVRQFIEQLWNQRDTTAIDKYIDPDVVGHGTPPLRGSEGMYALAQGTLNAFPDLFFDVHDLFGEGDKVVGRYTLGGTLREAWAGLPASNSTVSLEGILIFRLVDERIKEAWVISDNLGMMLRAGVIDVPEMA